MRRVLIGTPSYDGRIDVWFANSLVSTVKMSYEKDVFVHAIYTSYDSLVQRARNSLFKLALEGGYDDLFFIDSDVEWEPEWFFRLLERPEPIVGAALVKKSEKESYTVKVLEKHLTLSDDKKLLEVDGIGTGFMKISRFALEKLWEMSAPYKSEGEEHRMICDIKVENGDLISEDYIICNKWKGLGYKIWMDPTITINHIGIKKYKGDVSSYMKKVGYVW
jgi:glycosyltransferase involved in cell wall biosynthesis